MQGKSTGTAKDWPSLSQVRLALRLFCQTAGLDFEEYDSKGKMRELIAQLKDAQMSTSTDAPF
jgi:hypothetical protein